MINIYLLAFPNGKHYVGRTKNTFEQRLTEHKSRIGTTQHPLYYAFEKYGWDNVEKRILEKVKTHNEAVQRELHYIIQYDSLVNGYNLTLNTEIGGDNWKGRRDTPEYHAWRERIASKLRGDLNHMHGKSHANKTKELMKEKAKGRFSLQWFIERYGEEEGTLKYNDRCLALRSRKLKKDTNGRFTKQ